MDLASARLGSGSPVTILRPDTHRFTDGWRPSGSPAGSRIGDFTIITKRDRVRQSTHRHAVPSADYERARVPWLGMEAWLRSSVYECREGGDPQVGRYRRNLNADQ
jgi:hypothetical protein